MVNVSELVLFSAYGISCQKSVCLTYSCSHYSNNDMRNMISLQAVMLNSHKTHTHTHTYTDVHQTEQTTKKHQTHSIPILHAHIHHHTTERYFFVNGM